MKPKEDVSIRQQNIEAWMKPDKQKQIKEWLSQGISEAQLAHNMGISRGTMRNWKAENENFADLIADGKTVADTEVVNALYKRTQGYYYEETLERLCVATGELELVERRKKYLPPDMSAIVFWLKNRANEEWKDKIETEEKTDNQLSICFGSEDDLQQFEEYAN